MDRLYDKWVVAGRRAVPAGPVLARQVLRRRINIDEDLLDE